MAYNKKNAYKNEWNGNYQHIDKALQCRKMVAIIIQQEYGYTKTKAENCKNNPTNIFPFPRNYQKSDHNIAWNEVKEETTNLLPDG